MSAAQRWKELQELGQAKFILRERALIIGTPVGFVYSLLFSGVELSVWRSYFSSAFVLPVIASMVAGVVFGAAEWAEARERADREASSKE